MRTNLVFGPVIQVFLSLAASPLLAREAPSLVLRNDSGGYIQIRMTAGKGGPAAELASPMSLRSGAVLKLDLDGSEPDPVEFAITGVVAFLSFDPRRTHDVVEICRLTVKPAEHTAVTVTDDRCAITEDGGAEPR